MSTTDASLRATLFPSINQQGFRPGVYSPQSETYSLNSYARASRTLASRSTANSSRSSANSTIKAAELPTSPTGPPTGRRSNSPIFSLAQQPSASLSVMSYRRLGMPRGEMLPEFMRIDINSQQEMKVDTLSERVKLLDIFMANFANQFNGTNKPKSPPASRSITQSPEMRRSHTDIDEIPGSASIMNPQSSTTVSNQPLKRSQTPTIASRNKRRQATRMQANKHERPGSFVRSKTFDAALLENELTQSTPQLAAAIVSLTRRDKTMPLTFSGDVRAPAPSLFPRDIPELWSTITPNQNNQQPKQQEFNKSLTKVHFLLNSGGYTGRWTHDSQPDKQNVPVESANVANIKRLLQANKISVITPPEQVKLTTARANNASSKITTATPRTTLNRSRSMSPVASKNTEKRSTNPKLSPPAKPARQASPSNNNCPKSPAAKPESAGFLTQEARETSLPVDMSSYRQASRLLTSANREKSTKTVRFQLVEDVRFFDATPWSPLVEGAKNELSNTEPRENKGKENNNDKPEIPASDELAQEETITPQ